MLTDQPRLWIMLMKMETWVKESSKKYNGGYFLPMLATIFAMSFVILSKQQEWKVL